MTKKDILDAVGDWLNEIKPWINKVEGSFIAIPKKKFEELEALLRNSEVNPEQ